MAPQRNVAHLVTILLSLGAGASAQAQKFDPGLAYAYNPTPLEPMPCERCLVSQAAPAANPLLHKIYLYGVGDNGSVWDYRIQVMPEQLGPLRATGLIKTENDKFINQATASLVSPCHILTNAHVASDTAHGKEWKSITFYVGDALTPVTARRIKGASGDFRFNGDCPNDYEVLRLDRCVGDEFGYLPIWAAPIDKMQKEGVLSAGHPQTRDPKRPYDSRKGLVLDPSCDVTGLIHSPNKFGTQFTSNCASDSGDSGGPIVTNGRQTRGNRLVGLNCADTNVGHPFQQPRPNAKIGVANLFTPAYSFYERVRQVIESPEEQAFIARNAKDHGQVFGKDASTGAAGSRPQPENMTDLDELDRNLKTKPKGWIQLNYSPYDL